MFFFFDRVFMSFLFPLEAHSQYSIINTFLMYLN